MDINKICPHCMHELQNEGMCSYCKKDPRKVAEVSHQLRPFTILQGKYLIGNVLGEGGFGITYIGLDINLEIPVAIKEFYPNGFVTRESSVTTTLTVYSSVDSNVVEKWKDNFLREAKCLARCAKLPGVVGVKDFFHENNTVYIVQEYLEGEDLKNHIKSRGGKIPADEVIRNMEPVIKALKEVHDEGLIHRDISPDNIRLLKNGTMKVMDFGAARSFAEENEKSKSVLLKPGYAPEEQYRTRGKQGPWTDVYALCATMYKCITGVTPLESMERLRHDEMKWPSEMGIPVSPNFEAVLKKGMAVIAENRIQNMQELYNSIYHGAVISENPGVAFSAMTGTNQTMQTGFGNTTVSQTSYTQPMPQTVSQTSYTQSMQQTASQMPNVPPMQQQGMQDHSFSAGDSTKKTKMNKTMLIIALGSFLCICLLGVAIAVGGGKKEKALKVTTTTETTTTENMQAQSEEASGQSGSYDAELSRLMELKEAAQGLDDITLYDELLNETAEIYAACGSDEEVQKVVKEIYVAYQEVVLEYVNMIKSIEDFTIAHYQECSIRFEELSQWNETLNCGYESELSGGRDLCKKEYKNKYVKHYDDECMKTLQENGLVSRTVAWNILEGIDGTDLYDANSNGDESYRYDALRLRYISARVYKVLKDIDAGMSTDDLINMVKGLMIECDYDPMLVYLLAINGYEPAEAWLSEVEYILYTYGAIEGYSIMNDSDRLNFVYLYNVVPEEYKECRERIIRYMQDYYY